MSLRRIMVVVTFLALVVAAPIPAFARSFPHPSAQKGIGFSKYRNARGPICTTSSTAANVNTDCENVAPVNETAIAVNPLNPLNMIGSANDEQIRVTHGGTAQAIVFSRAHVTFDGGQTWTIYPVPFESYKITGDPSIAFDANGTAYLATLGFGFESNPDVLVSHSTDGGITWSKPARVAGGTGSFHGKGTLHDHPVLTAWGDGNVDVTWIKYVFGPHFILESAPMDNSVSHDGGETWSDPVDISGSADFCVGLSAPNACDQTWGNSPAISDAGRLLVSFYDTYQYTPDGATNLGRDTHMVVEVDPDTGLRVAGPYFIGLAYDGINEQDYPVDAVGRQTLQDSEFRLLHQGNIVADPTDPTGNHFAVVWFDDRNAPHPVNPDPYQAVTNADIIVSQTFDGGVTWSDPQAIEEPNDQFMPWAAYDDSGRLRVGYFDRSYDAANHLFGYTLATETTPGSLTFSLAQVTTELSDPTQGDRWSRITVDPDFPDATLFLGDYSGIAAIPGGGVATYWTDMRETACLLDVCGHGEDAFYATMP